MYAGRVPARGFAVSLSALPFVNVCGYFQTWFCTWVQMMFFLNLFLTAVFGVAVWEYYNHTIRFFQIPKSRGAGLFAFSKLNALVREGRGCMCLIIS